ncbi:MAG TPA: hypothetical protein VGN36_03675 [Sphingorhabdus sp.]|nr:hypothetical protein [Sphingorhabdus sp.]
MRFVPLALTLLALTACGGSKEDNQVTETRMDDIDSLEGTISDDAINMDASTDEAPVEAAPSETKSDDNKKAEPKLDQDEAKDSGGPDVVKIEPAKDAE